MVLHNIARTVMQRQRLISGILVGSGTFVAARHLATTKDPPECSDVELSQQEWNHLHALARRTNLLYQKGSDWVDVASVRRWHVSNAFLGGIVLRQLSVDERLYVDTDWTGTSEKARRECYYLYYEILGTGRREQHLFIRGSYLLDDLITDLRIRKAWDEECGCYLHAGFLAKASILLDDLMPLLDQKDALVLAGHSLGGAMALIVAMKLAKRGYNVHQVVTFGAPKALTSSGCDIWRDRLRVLRVVHHDDPFPTLPMLSLDPHVAFDRYTHFGDVVLLLDGSGQEPYVGLRGKGSESYLVDSFWLTAHPWRPLAHTMSFYETAMQERAQHGATRVPYRARWDCKLCAELDTQQVPCG